MRLGRIVLHRFRSLLLRSRAETEMQRELDLHIEQLTKEHIADGMSESEARLAARREFGSLDVTREQCSRPAPLSPDAVRRRPGPESSW